MKSIKVLGNGLKNEIRNLLEGRDVASKTHRLELLSGALHWNSKAINMRRASIREMIVQWHDYVELFEMNEDNIIDANEGLNEFDDNPYGPFLIGIFGL